MLNIRREQFEAFSPGTDQEIIDFIIGHLNDESPELIDRIPINDLRVMVFNGISRARTHGLRSLADITGFVSIMFEIAPNFDEIHELKTALHDNNIPQDDRFSSLFESKYDEAWEKAANLDNERTKIEAWFPDLRDEP